MKKLIINADDFGLCGSVNRGILECLKHGIVTDFSFMINKNEFYNSHRLLSEEGITNVGFHLNLTVGNSISAQNSALTDQSGKFFKLPTLFFKIINGQIPSSDIYGEIKAQIELLKNQGYTITHIDSHTNIHLLPIVFDSILKIRNEMNLKVPVRIPLERQINLFRMYRSNVIRIFILNFLSWYVIFRMRYRNGIQTIGGDFFNNRNQPQVLDHVLQRIMKSKFEVFEMAVHPGFPSTEIALYDEYNGQRQWEFNVLSEKRNFKFNSEIKLCSFGEVAKSRQEAMID